MHVPLFDMAAELAPIRAEIDEAIKRVLDSGVFIGGREVIELEGALAASAGVTRAVGTSSGTDALLLALLALGVDRDAEVVSTPLTFFATVGSAARLGARIVFADIDDASLTLDPAAALAGCTPRTRAVIPVHLFGHPAVLSSVPCPIVEDSAHRAGALSLRGTAAAISFFPTKSLGALGDAGAILVDDVALADRMVLLRAHGARPKYHHMLVGGNFRLDALQAAVLRTKLPHLGEWTARRRELARRYRDAFAASRTPPELRLPAHHPDHTYQQFVIRAPRRDALRDHLAKRGVGTEVYYPVPHHLQPCFADLGYRRGSFPIAERACAEVLALPLQPGLGDDAIGYVVDAITGFYA
jgi:dTDP-4-amino-4,6-dideoxygalactose transaminase